MLGALQLQDLQQSHVLELHPSMLGELCQRLLVILVIEQQASYQQQN